MRAMHTLPKHGTIFLVGPHKPARSLRAHGHRLCELVRGVGVVAALAFAAPAVSEPGSTYQLDPFAQATAGYVGCPETPPPLLSEQEMRIQAHERAERGTSCCLAGTCGCGGAYRRDPEINARVVAVIAADRRFRDSSVWVTTMRKFVTLQGCVRSKRQKQLLEHLVKRQPDVAIVWNETIVGTTPRKP